MNLDLTKLLKYGVYALVSVAFLSLWIGKAIGTGIAALFVLAIAASWFWERPRAKFEALEKVWTGLTVLYIAFSGYLLFMTEQGFVRVGVYLVLYLTGAKLFQRARLADHVQLLALSFLLIASSTAFNEDILFALFFAIYVVVGVITFSIYHLNLQLEENAARGGRRVKQLFGAQYMSVLGGMALVSFVFAVAFFFFVPRLGFGFFKTKTRQGVQQTSGFQDDVSLGKHGTIKADNTVVMRVEFPSGAPAGYELFHWRGNALDYYDGVGWKTRLKRKSAVFPNADYEFGLGSYTGPKDQLLTQNIYLEPLEDSDVLFALPPAVALGLSSKDKALPIWLKNNKGITRNPNDTLRTEAISRAGYQYTATSWVGAFDPISGSYLRYPNETLNSVTVDDQKSALGQRHFDAYTQLPGPSPKIKALTDKIVADANATSPYQIAQAISTHLRTQYAYSLDLFDPAGEPPLEAFLFTHKRGHCEYFASATVIMLRTQGIAARLTNGFLGGSWNHFDDFLAVRNADAHSWVEVNMGKYGWITVEPTPGEANVSLRSHWYDGFAKFYDSLRFKWVKYVIEYDLDTQIEFLRAATQALGGDEESLEPEQARVTFIEILNSLRRNRNPMILVVLWGLAAFVGIVARGGVPLDRKDWITVTVTVGGSYATVLALWNPEAGKMAQGFAVLAPSYGLFMGLFQRRVGRKKKGANHKGISLLYAQLRDALRDVGIEDAEQLGPAALLARAQAMNLPALEHIESLIQRYMDVRFGGAELEEKELKTLNKTAKTVKKALRALSRRDT